MHESACAVVVGHLSIWYVLFHSLCDRHRSGPYLIIPVSHCMIEIIVAPSQVFTKALHSRVSIGAVHDIVIGIPCKVPVPGKGWSVMPGTEFIVLVDQPAHNRFWVSGRLSGDELSAGTSERVRQVGGSLGDTPAICTITAVQQRCTTAQGSLSGIHYCNVTLPLMKLVALARNMQLRG